MYKLNYIAYVIFDLSYHFIEEILD